MQRWILPAAALLLLGTTAEVRADRAAPPSDTTVRLGERNVKLVVVIDDKVKEPRLQIPQSLLAGGGKKSADAGPRLPTIMAGLALSVSLVAAGFWLVRRGPGRRLAAVVLAVSLLACGASAVWANVGPKPIESKDRPTLVAMPAGILLPEQIVLEVVPRGDAVRLIVNEKALKSAGTVKPERSSAKPEE
jgi:hypothetical protein